MAALHLALNRELIIIFVNEIVLYLNNKYDS